MRRLIVARFDAEVAGGRDGPAREPIVVVKEPGSHVADLLMRLSPGSRMIFLLRDGRDVVDSWLAAYRHKQIRSATPGGWRDNLTPAEHDVMHEEMGLKLAEFGYLEPEPVGLA